MSYTEGIFRFLFLYIETYRERIFIFQMYNVHKLKLL